MNLFYEMYPESIEIHGERVPIVTDFREYIKLLDMLKDPELSDTEKAYCLKEYFLCDFSDFNEAIKQLSSFVAMDEVEQAGVRKETDTTCTEKAVQQKQLYSFSIDYPYIIAGFLRDYRIDLTSVDYLHWWKFRMLFDSLSEDTEIKQRIMYRSIDLSTIKDKDERKRISKIQRSIQLPQEQLTDYEIGDMFA
ncbi:MAG: bacteriophage Gp15 family protein [Lachnospiraceae bacterium]|nr:bacteriophage Gp15 family protein [Lachnospiraceae bacterium]